MESDVPVLRRIHSDRTLEQGPQRFSLNYWRMQSTEMIVASLAPGMPEPLIVKPDGRVMQGNTRIKVLEERGYDVNTLPRTVIE